MIAIGLSLALIVIAAGALHVFNLHIDRGYTKREIERLTFRDHLLVDQLRTATAIVDDQLRHEEERLSWLDSFELAEQIFPADVARLKEIREQRKP